MSFTYTQLRTEIQNDPAALGYAALGAGQTQGIANLLNLASGKGSASVALGAALSKNTLLNMTMAMLGRCGAGIGVSGNPVAASICGKWIQIYNHVRAYDPGTMITVNSSIGNPVTDDVMSSAEGAAIAAASSRAGSRAEVLWGVGTIIQPADVAFALSGAA